MAADALGEQADDEGLDIVKMLRRWALWQLSSCGGTRGTSGLVGAYQEWQDHGSGMIVNRDPEAEKLDNLIYRMGCVMGIQYRHAIEMKYLRGYSNQLAGDVLGCSCATFKIRVQAAEWWLNGVMFGIRIRVVS